MGAVAPVVTAPVPARLHLSGGKREKRTGRACSGGRLKYAKDPKARTARKRTAAINQARRASPRGPLRLTGTDAGSPACKPPSAIHFSSSHTSLAACHLFSGSLARHFFTTRASAGGVIG